MSKRDSEEVRVYRNKTVQSKFGFFITHLPDQPMGDTITVGAIGRPNKEYQGLNPGDYVSYDAGQDGIFEIRVLGKHDVPFQENYIHLLITKIR